MPGGINQSLTLETAKDSLALSHIPLDSSGSSPVPAPAATSTLRPGSKERRLAEKELNSLQNKMGSIDQKLADVDAKLVALAPDDYDTMGALAAERAGLADDKSTLETRWLELSALLE
jgi:hypothetical protein